MNLAVHSESNNILSLRSYFQSKGGTFWRHSVDAFIFADVAFCLVSSAENAFRLVLATF